MRRQIKFPELSNLFARFAKDIVSAASSRSHKHRCRRLVGIGEVCSFVNIRNGARFQGGCSEPSLFSIRNASTIRESAAAGSSMREDVRFLAVLAGQAAAAARSRCAATSDPEGVVGGSGRRMLRTGRDTRC
jgi:hypothetical protein